MSTSPVGDADLDGEFNSRDLVHVFQASQYEDAFLQNSEWQTGDWNADSEFTSSDLVAAFQDEGYESGPRFIARAVPEVHCLTVPVALLIVFVQLSSCGKR